MANHVKKQHFVSRFLLNHFADEQRNIWCYDKEWKRVAQKGIGGVAFEEYFYDTMPGVKEGSKEYIYQRAETHVAPIIQKIILSNSLTCIAVDEKVALAIFIVMQINRTKVALKETERFQKEFKEPIQAFADAHGAQLDIELGSAKDLWFSSLDSTPRLSEVLMRKVWYLGSSDSGFYSSDNPVVRGNYLNKEVSGIRGVLGLDSDGIEIYFPLTPSLILCLLCERSYSTPKENILPYLPINIKYVNHLQVMQSDKFVFSANGDFRLAEEVLRGDRVGI